MNGADQMDQAISAYLPTIQNRKQYWTSFTYCVGVGLYNSWLLYRSLEKDCPFIDHLRSIARSYLGVYTHTKQVISSANRAFLNSQVSNQVDKSVRFDVMNDLLGTDAKKFKCILCVKTTIKKCTKSNVKLHDYCFSAFHGLTE